MSGLPEPLLLDAAHIVADANERLGQPVVPNGLPLSKIHRYFPARGVFDDLDIAAMPEPQPEELWAAWLTLNDTQRHAINTAFRDIAALSGEKGCRAILDDAAWHFATDPDAHGTRNPGPVGFLDPLCTVTRSPSRESGSVQSVSCFQIGSGPRCAARLALRTRTCESDER